MALAETAVYDVRAGANDTNAGAYNPARAGAAADYTHQTSPQHTYTDLVIGAVTTTLTSALRPFSPADVGNHLRITGGTGFTTGLYEIVSVTGAVATMDRSVGTAASVSGAGRLGGALLTVAAATATAILGNTIWARTAIVSALGDVSLQLVSAPAATAVHRSRQLWREFTNEPHADPISDSVVDRYLNAALRWLNRKIRYHFTDTSITLTAETQEYDLNEDVFEIVWVEWNGIELKKSSVEQWRTRQVRWRQQGSGTPVEWAFYGSKLVLLPKPNANAVNASATLTVRAVSTPKDFSSFGMAQLAVQDQDVPVFYAASLWSKAHPDSALAIQRRDSLQAEADGQAELVRDFYDRRLVSR